MYKDIIKIFKDNTKFLLASHANPDGDAIGSMLALGEALNQMKKKVYYYNSDKVPSNLMFLKDSSMVTDNLSESEFDVLVLIDCSNVSRLGDKFGGKTKKYKKIICIDHHDTDEFCGDAGAIRKEAAATAELIYELLKAMKTKITPDMANQLYCGLSVDTGSFQYSNTSAYVFKILAELVELGADPWLVASNLNESVELGQLKLLKETLGTLKLELNNRYAFMVLTKQMFEKAGATLDMCEEFITFPRSIKTVEIAALFREKNVNEWKVSLRSKNYVDLVKIVRKFDGGGHYHAAGCTIKGELSVVQKKILDVIAEVL